MVVVTNITNSRANKGSDHMFEVSQIIYHLTSDSYPLMLSLQMKAGELERVIKVNYQVAIGVVIVAEVYQSVVNFNHLDLTYLGRVTYSTLITRA